MAGTAILFSRRYTPSCARWWMLWFMTHVRRQTALGMVNKTLPLSFKDHGLASSASETPAMAARASFTYLSKRSSISLVVLGGGGCSIFLPPGDISSSSCWMVMLAHDGMSARCDASQIMLPDLSCGFQENFASGTRSRVLRVLAIS